MSAYFPPLPHDLPRRTLMPGELFCHRTPHALQTLLGSCVSLCLWDCRLRFGGMNHFLLPTRPANDEPSFRYGDVAVPALVQRMLDLGSTVGTLRAKLFGGAAVLGGEPAVLAVGQRNVQVALAELRRLRIPLAANRLAGDQGLALRFCTDCGTVWVRPVATRCARSAGYPEPAVLPQDLTPLPESDASAMPSSQDHAAPAVVGSRPQLTRHPSCHRCQLAQAAERCAS